MTEIDLEILISNSFGFAVKDVRIVQDMITGLKRG